VTRQSLLLDTHILLWLDSGDQRLRPPTRSMLEDHWRGGGTLLVSAVSAWEIAVLADVGRITLDLRPDAWFARFLARPGLVCAPLEASAAFRAYQLPGLPHRDPADRLLIATALEAACPLVTYDRRLQDYAEQQGASLGFEALGEPAA